jgi:hypothetical protein
MSDFLFDDFKSEFTVRSPRFCLSVYRDREETHHLKQIIITDATAFLSKLYIHDILDDKFRLYSIMTGTGVEFVENAYLEAINEHLFLRYHPDHPNKDSLFDQFETLIINGCNGLKYMGRTHGQYVLIIKSSDCSVWEATLDKDKGEYIWIFKWMTHTFKCTHDGIIQSDGKIVCDMIGKYTYKF